jgi:hypothetical protein
MSATVRHLRATVDLALEARITELVPLAYARGASVRDDVPAHVRAASAVRRMRSRLVIVQDDVNVLVLHDPVAGTESVLLPAGPGGLRTFDDARGNKRDKMDLEACASLPDGRLVAFGSGSTAGRERLVVLDDRHGVRIVDGAELYAMLRATPALSGSELNLEGALVIGDVLRILQRGNGAPVDGREPVNATGDLPLDAFVRWLDGGGRLPGVAEIVQYDLGHTGDAAFGFTDAAALPDGRMAFVACAEASPDTYRDGDVLGCRFGIADGALVRVTPILEGGHPTMLKLEGIELRDSAGPLVFDVVADVDRPDEPARLGRLDVRGQ